MMSLDRHQVMSTPAVCASLVFGSQYSPFPPPYRQPFPLMYPPSYSHHPLPRPPVPAPATVPVPAPAPPRPYFPVPQMPHTHYPAPGIGLTYSAPYSHQPHMYSHLPPQPVSPPVYPTPYYPRAQLYRSPQRSVRRPPGFSPEPPAPQSPTPPPPGPPRLTPSPPDDPSPERRWLPRNRV